MEKTPPQDAYPPGTVLTVGSHTAVISKYISEGGFAHVYAVEISPKVNNTSVACLKRVAVPDKASLNNLRAEVDSMKRLSGHRHIVSYIDSHAARRMGGEGYEVFVLMEYCANKGLIDFMNQRLQNRLTEQEVLRIMGEITEGVCNMHALQPPLIHRDIKIENVLISDNGDFKLCDFGSASPVLRPPKNADEFAILQNDVLKNTTPQYRSPEMIDLYRRLPIDEKSDIWALGVFLYKLCYYTTPFEARGELAILHASFDFPLRPIYSERLKNLISVLLREDPRRRPNAYQTLEEVCNMRQLPVPIADFTKVQKTLVSQSTQAPSYQLQPQQQPPQQKQLSPEQLNHSQAPSLNGIRSQINAPPSSTSNSSELTASNMRPIKSYNLDIPSSYTLDPFKNLKNNANFSTENPSKTSISVVSNIQNLNKSLGSLTLNNGQKASSATPSAIGAPTKPPLATKPVYTDGALQNDDSDESARNKGSTRVRSIHKRPQSMYVSSGSKTAQNAGGDGKLKEIINGLSSQSSRIEIPPGQNHIENNVEFLKNLQSEDSGKSWMQQSTGESTKSLRRISTENKKRNSLISQITGRFSRSHSRSSSIASSIHETNDINSHSTGTSSGKLRSSPVSNEEEKTNAPGKSKTKAISSIQKRVQALLNRSNDPPIVKTAQGYGNDDAQGSWESQESQKKQETQEFPESREAPITSSNFAIDQDGFKKPTLTKKKPPVVPLKKLSPQTPPSLSTQSTQSTIVRTPQANNPQTPSTIKKNAESPLTIKKSAPPPKPKKPAYLKSTIMKSPQAAKSSKPVLGRDNSGDSDSSLSDIDEWEQHFHEKFPKAI